MFPNLSGQKCDITVLAMPYILRSIGVNAKNVFDFVTQSATIVMYVIIKEK
jgi:hypothetical protein